METLKQYWKYILGGILAVVGVIFFQHEKIKDLESDKESSENKLDNAVTDAKVESLDNKIEEAKKEAEEKKDNATQEQVLDYLKKL